MATEEQQARKLEIVKATWDYLLMTGLSDASIGDLCKAARLSQSSIYYWFKNKEDLWICAGRYGLSVVVETMFSYTLSHTDKLDEYFENILSFVDEYKAPLRLAVEITANPVYGAKMRDKADDFKEAYDEFSKKMSVAFGCSFNDSEVFVYSILSSVIDYVVWDDGEKTQLVLNSVKERLLSAIEKQK